jgi:two-component system, NtrC family, C4-dicarboxylate transport sensor histidine kinase DctB
MSIPGNNPPTGPRPEDAARLAHELANLLDGGMRNLGLAMSSLRGTTSTPAPRPDEDVVHRLDAANRAMQQMATLVQRFMDRPSSLAELHRRTTTLQSVIGEAVEMVSPLAACHGIEIRVHVAAEAAPLPAGPVAPVVLNALRNAIDAIVALPDEQARRPYRIDLAATLVGERVEVRVGDNGVGIEPAILDERGHIRSGATTKPDGHGLGLGLAQDIARSLGGTLTLLPRRPHGAELVLMYPLSSVMAARH